MLPTCAIFMDRRRYEADYGANLSEKILDRFFVEWLSDLDLTARNDLLINTRHTWVDSSRWRMWAEMPHSDTAGQTVETKDVSKDELLSDLIKKHRGECREVRGTWEPVPSSVQGAFIVSFQLASDKQSEMDIQNNIGRGRYKCMYKQQLLDSNIATTLWSCIHGDWYVREAHVVTLAQLFLKMGPHFTCREIYWWYCNCSILVRKRISRERKTENFERRKGAAQYRKATTGRYGHTRD